MTPFLRSATAAFFVAIAVWSSPRSYAQRLTPASEVEVVVAPPVLVVERDGITGAGWASGGEATISSSGVQVVHFYPNHPDDFGKSVGIGSNVSNDGGRSWSAGPDDVPIQGVVDVWQDSLLNGRRIAVGIRALPDPKTRAFANEQTALTAWTIGTSNDEGRNWRFETAAVDCPSEIGVIARPLPHVIDAGNDRLFMPAYAWSGTGHRSVLLRSVDGGHRWTVGGCASPPTFRLTPVQRFWGGFRENGEVSEVFA